ncbi:MAG TPA: type IV pilus assembly protein PilM [Deltaproteobacteria bacterium]|nr:type IV pilus assembly protein PilM [Deltaproteobacteria bacterium]
MVSIKELMLGSKRVVGLDIGSSLIKLIEIDDTSQGAVLRTYEEIPVQPGAIENGIIKDSKAITEHIKGIFKNSRCSVKNVITALSGHAVIIKKANFAHMKEEELRELLTDEAENYMPFDDVREINFDFHVIGENDLNPNQMDVVIVAAKKDVIEDWIAAIERAGRKVVIVDVDSFALETAYEQNYDFGGEDIVALLNIGASITNINILKGGQSVFTRNFLLGGNTITEAIQQKLNISFEEAEKIKHEGGNGSDISKLDLINYAEPIFSEIERSIDFFSSTFMDPYLKQVLISGGCAKLPGIVDALANRLNSGVEIFNPFKNISHDKKTFPEQYLTSIAPIATLGVGLALRRMDDK